MKVVIQDQTEELDPRLRRYTEKRLGMLSRRFEKVLEAEVHFTPESRRGGETEEAAVKILIHPDGRKKPILKAEARGRDLHVALDLALDKVDHQLLKLKDRIVNRHHSKREEGGAGIPSPTVTEAPERVITRVKAESVSQAMDALEANGHLFHLFLDEDTGDLCVIYRRGDGSVAIIEPRIT
jgi:putative sigma-54 modulation protein